MIEKKLNYISLESIVGDYFPNLYEISNESKPQTIISKYIDFYSKRVKCHCLLFRMAFMEII